MSSCFGQGMTDLMSKFKSASTTITTFSKPHPHNTTQTTTQTTPQTFSSFTKTGFMKFNRPK